AGAAAMRQYIEPMTSRPDDSAMAAGGAGPSAKRLTRVAARTRSLLSSWRAAAGGRCLVCRGWCDGGLCRPCDARFAAACERCEGCGLPHTPGHAIGELRCVRCRLAP